MYTFLKWSWLEEYSYVKFKFQTFSGKKLENFKAIQQCFYIFSQKLTLLFMKVSHYLLIFKTLSDKSKNSKGYRGL